VTFNLFTVLLLFPFCLTANETKTHIPEDVSNFVEQRDGCDHFRGEPPYNEERRKFLYLKVTELCLGIDEQLNLLKIKYEKNREVINFLIKHDVETEQKTH